MLLCLGNVMSNGMPVAATGVSPFQTIPSGNGQVPQRSQNVAPHDSNSMTTVTSANPGFPPPGFAGPPFITQTSFQPIIQVINTKVVIEHLLILPTMVILKFYIRQDQVFQDN